ncbi:MAG: hypothetical protein HOB19_05925 [Elusimicrobiaceae bacterium]|nr:hypothetical protein [Elusimicrobiaceae bacterium]
MPSLLKAFAISTPIAPAPIMVRVFGISEISNRLEFVKYFVLSSPEMGGTNGEEPVASINFSAVNFLPFKEIVLLSKNFGSPKSTLMPAFSKTSG